MADSWWFDYDFTSYFGRSSAREVAMRNSVTARINVKEYVGDILHLFGFLLCVVGKLEKSGGLL